MGSFFRPFFSRAYLASNFMPSFRFSKDFYRFYDYLVTSLLPSAFFFFTFLPFEFFEDWTEVYCFDVFTFCWEYSWLKPWWDTESWSIDISSDEFLRRITEAELCSSCFRISNWYLGPSLSSSVLGWFVVSPRAITKLFPRDTELIFRLVTWAILVGFSLCSKSPMPSCPKLLSPQPYKVPFCVKTYDDPLLEIEKSLMSNWLKLLIRCGE